MAHIPIRRLGLMNLQQENNSRTKTLNCPCMYLYFYQIEELLQIIHNNQKVAFDSYEESFVTAQDKAILLRYGVDYKKLCVKGADPLYKPFNFGMLAEALQKTDQYGYSYEQLKEFVRKGKYIPQSERDQLIIKFIVDQPM